VRQRTTHLWLTALVALLAGGLALAGPPVGALLEGPAWLGLRLPLGLAALFVLPGHALATLLFPRSDDLDGFERAALAVGISLVQIPFLALALDRSPWGLSPAALVVSLSALTPLWCALAALRIARLAPDAAFAPALRLETLKWSALSRLERAAVLLSAVLVGVVAWSLSAVSSQPDLPPLTEFFVLGREGLAESYPRAAAPGEPVSVTVGATNREGRPMEYRVVARRGELPLAQLGPVRVAAGETWREQLTFALPDYGFDQRVEVLLFRAGDAEPYRSLRLIVDVPQPGVPTPVRVVPTVAPGR
jgi:uncharacterized membrane protein